MIFFTRVDEDNIKWYFIAPDDYPLDGGDVTISAEKFYNETNQYSLFIKPVSNCDYKSYGR